MKALWSQISSRVNALTLRERFLLFACVVTVLGMLTHVFFISPLLEQQKILVAQIDKKSSAMDIQREELNLAMLKRGRDRAAELNAAGSRLQGDIAAIEREIAGFSSAGSDAAAMSAILARVLRSSDKVVLVRVMQVGAEPAGVATPGAANAPRGGLDITLSGSYLDLMEYLATLEKALPQARWGVLRLKAETLPAQVTVRIVTTADT